MFLLENWLAVTPRGQYERELDEKQFWKYRLFELWTRNFKSCALYHKNSRERPWNFFRLQIKFYPRFAKGLNGRRRSLWSPKKANLVKYWLPTAMWPSQSFDHFHRCRRRPKIFFFKSQQNFLFFQSILYVAAKVKKSSKVFCGRQFSLRYDAEVAFCLNIFSLRSKTEIVILRHDLHFFSTGFSILQ